ncbi:MFS transporter [Leptolyngbya sp. O-77]|uniref:MFS transporter n=1 Tax=Leptolyngbya sp. O-77 TaxID=1080068 RepID=UPI00074D3B6F|nr:MFS transporter [Leptolyngbya sp. O-77]BAU43618.1 multidrug resistance protein MdtH [Leptolyngbya sp. O-77]
MNLLFASVQSANRLVWIQAIGRLLCQIAYGLISFYIPILFVNHIGLSAASVGFAVGLSAVSEVSGHFIGGTLADLSGWGRKRVLVLAAALGIGVSLMLSVATTLPLLIVASLVLGISLGFYWTASNAAVMDAAPPEERHHAFALMGVSEYVGVGAGVFGGSLLLGVIQDVPQTIFLGCAAIFLAYLLLMQFTMQPGQQPQAKPGAAEQGILVALKDKLLLVFMAANVFFTTYVALVTSTIPLYFTNFVAGADPTPGVSVSSTASLFTWCYIGVGAVLQLPLAQLLTPYPRVRVLMAAMLLWGAGFSLLWATGSFEEGQFIWGVVALCLLSIGSVAYKPFFSAIVSDLAPDTLRGAYMAVSSQCWTIGYFIGPVIGGWAMDQSASVAHVFWLVVGASSLLCVGILWIFEAMNPAIAHSTVTPSALSSKPES